MLKIMCKSLDVLEMIGDWSEVMIQVVNFLLNNLWRYSFQSERSSEVYVNVGGGGGGETSIKFAADKFYYNII